MSSICIRCGDKWAKDKLGADGVCPKCKDERKKKNPKSTRPNPANLGEKS
jgi:hypothetical protein